MTKPKNPTFSQAELHEVLEYHPDTGVFTRKSSGKSCGYPNEKGYLRFDVLCQGPIRAHRLAWFYVYGVWPTWLDHINGDPADNRIANLRECEEWQNHINSPRRKKVNKTGYHGVVAKRSTGRLRFYGSVSARGVEYKTRLYATPAEAAEARKALARLHHGVFAKI